ncbi:hypothetical protein DFH06DRAFT_1439649 [Mycena polygramma]|nr:hypothetical protein DFH06DRAFT_1439649 [Mycena polygramma]
MLESSKGIPTPFLHHATVAATTLKQLSEINTTPYLQVVAGVALLILQTAQSVKKNKEQCVALVEQIYEIICALIELCADTSAPLSPVLLDGMAMFAETLQKIDAFLRMQQDTNRLKRFLKHQEHTSRLEDCKAGLRDARDVFATKTAAVTLGDVAEFQATMERKHHELLKLIVENSFSDQGSSGFGSIVGSLHFNTKLTLWDRHSFSSLSIMIPSAPQVFHGRQSELRDAADRLLKDGGRVAILGPGGIGKTALAKSLLHQPDVVAKYPVRYFVSCDSAVTVEDLALAVAGTLGLELSGKLTKAIIKHLSAQPSCLLVLDNFETPWERIETRDKVEEFLAILGDLTHVALLMTIRGQERPSKIRWTRPFIPALKPLSFDAARETFMDIADTDSDEDAAHVSELLALTENLPLAVTLVASISAFEGCEAVLARWKTENVSLLSDGTHKETSLEISLRLSLSSPRMSSSPGALHLLSLLSLLPDGISDADLLESSVPIPDLLRCKSTLLRTSLAYNDAERLKVLAPVRELMKKLHPPGYTLARPLRLHWERLLQLWRTFQMPSRDLAQRLAGNAGNLNSLLKFGLEVDAPDLKEVVYGIFYLDTFTSRTYGNTSPLMTDISAHVQRVNDNGLHGYYIWHIFAEQKGVAPSDSEATDLLARGCKYYQLAGDLSGESKLHHAVSVYSIRVGNVNKATTHAEMSFTLADQADDDVRRTRALVSMATCRRMKGKFSEAVELARRAQWIAGRIGNFQRETDAMEEEAVSWLALGNLSQAMEICRSTRQLIIAGGIEKTVHDIGALDFEAEICLYQTAYSEARKCRERIVEYSSPEKFPLYHGHSLAAIADIDVAVGVFNSEGEVTAALVKPRQIFAAHNYLFGPPLCDKIVADFLLADGRTLEAVKMYDACVQSLRAESTEFILGCMLKLGDITLRPDAVRSTTHWATAYLACGKITGNVSAVIWALRLLGDIFRAEGDEETSASLFQLALEEFTRMDIYRGRADCLLRLAEMAQKRGENNVATEHFREARRMFLKSGMVLEAEKIQQN